MPGIKLLTKLDPTICYKVAWRTAQDLGYSIPPLDENSTSFTATKGNFVTRMLGPISLYCRLDISVHAYPSANEIVIEKNNPWLSSGAIGRAKVNKLAEEYITALSAAIEKEGGSIVERKEF